jgi:hypothetical protein
LEGCAGLAAAAAKPDLALQLFGASLRLREVYGFGPDQRGQATVNGWLESARNALGEEHSAAQVDTGRQMDLQHAIATAMEP